MHFGDKEVRRSKLVKYRDSLPRMWVKLPPDSTMVVKRAPGFRRGAPRRAVPPWWLCWRVPAGGWGILARPMLAQIPLPKSSLYTKGQPVKQRHKLETFYSLGKKIVTCTHGGTRWCTLMPQQCTAPCTVACGTVQHRALPCTTMLADSSPILIATANEISIAIEDFDRLSVSARLTTVVFVILQGFLRHMVHHGVQYFAAPAATAAPAPGLCRAFPFCVPSILSPERSITGYMQSSSSQLHPAHSAEFEAHTNFYRAAPDVIYSRVVHAAVSIKGCIPADSASGVHSAWPGISGKSPNICPPVTAWARTPTDMVAAYQFHEYLVIGRHWGRGRSMFLDQPHSANPTIYDRFKAEGTSEELQMKDSKPRASRPKAPPKNQVPEKSLQWHVGTRQHCHCGTPRHGMPRQKTGALVKLARGRAALRGNNTATAASVTASQTFTWKLRDRQSVVG
ncbi:hypothetical protein B0H16DRAFT_1468803 [Mycena metata]|uniref:Uncharacterized protein n=1 Tax=Mycena metata TaxID=1033252 RepID=A0AAD7HZV9_9AGAR|nr:hypothetical protein B0H16DRAFT_1468803 [Mycena metata]